MSDSACIFAADALLEQVLILTREAPGVRLGEDIEFLHRMRVASRRLRTMLILFADYLPAKRAVAWGKGIRRITRALGEARDADVQCARLDAFVATAEPRALPGLARLLLRLRQQRARLQRQVLRALDDVEEGSLLPEMEAVLRLQRAQAADDGLDPLYLTAEQSINQRLTDLLSYEVYLDDPARVTELHAMRIAAKRLRYSLEAFSPLYGDVLKPAEKAVKALQEVLGEIHDSDVWLTLLPAFLAEERIRAVEYTGHTRGMARLRPGIEAMLTDCRDLRHQNFAQLRKRWEQYRAARLWPTLRELLHTRPASTEAPPT